MKKNWIVNAAPAGSEVTRLCNEINVSQPVASILLQRGIQRFEDARAFFSPDLSELHDPFLMKDMRLALNRLLQAMQNKEKILIYGDYDVDGTTAVSLVYGFLRQFYPHVDYYIPDRYSEGYGLSAKGVDYAQKTGTTLLVTLDCGIKAIDKVAYGNQLGIDFIICDHHTPGSELPPAVAVLDPKQADCPYPCKELTGCGIGFKLMQALCIHNNIPYDTIFQYLDLAGISIACDIVPVTGENRVLLKYGLELINTSPRPGIKAMLEIAGIKSTLNTGHLVFGIGPRINAAGRIAHANHAVLLLLAKTEEEALEAAKNVDAKNTIRKDYDSSITEEALEMIRQQGIESRKSTVLYKTDWHKGVIGIVASRCIEHFYRPTIILTESGGMATGSARSVAGFNIYKAIEACSDLLERFGGHKYAAGLTLKAKNLAAFTEKFENEVAARITPEQLVPTQKVDFMLELRQITENFFKVLERMAPFGPGNMRPVFASEVVADEARCRVLKEKHLKMLVREANGKTSFDAIGFNMAHLLEKIIPGQPFYICYNIEENHYMGRTSLQLQLRDIKSADEKAEIIRQGTTVQV